ncbi:MAG: alpha/beta hydrolase [Candidatus Saccharibacteria bacterium]
MHGKTAKPSDGWYPILGQAVEAKGIPFFAPVLPHTNDPDITEWKDVLTALQPDEDTVLIGHSRGSVAILRWLEDQKAGVHISKVILTAANVGDGSGGRAIPATSRGFYTEAGYDFDAIKSHCDEFVIVHSKNDTVVDFAAAESNAKGLNAQLVVYEDQGHFDSGTIIVPDLILFIIDSR